jgi:hypothetical protein
LVCLLLCVCCSLFLLLLLLLQRHRRRRRSHPIYGIPEIPGLINVWQLSTGLLLPC